MSRGDLQEMEQSKTAVNANAKAGDSMPKLADPGTQLASVEDLGGPTPENYKPDDDSAKLKEPKIKTVKDVVNRGAKSADAMAKMSKEETEVEEEVLEEDQVDETEEVIEEESSEDDGIDIDEDVNALLGGEELSEEFREKAKVIFEAALNSKVKEIQAVLEERYDQALQEEKEGLKESLTERVDSYLEYVCEEWMTENALAVEAGLKTDMTESFLAGMKGLFEEHYVTIPEEKYDVLESMVDKLDEMETKLNEQIDKNISLNKRLAESVADGILDQISEGLAETQKEKLASLAESVEFESEEEYRGKLETLKESYFSSTSTSAPQASQQTLSEGVDTTDAPAKAGMDQYLKALGAFNK
tara:strand:+ start:7337 stop:8413 length:1077 start_codon:yes stop_codon:yes gene_type:complete